MITDVKDDGMFDGTYAAGNRNKVDCDVDDRNEMDDDIEDGNKVDCEVEDRNKIQEHWFNVI